MEETKAKKTGGKKEGQKYKSLLVWDILLKKTDGNYYLLAFDSKKQKINKKGVRFKHESYSFLTSFEEH